MTIMPRIMVAPNGARRTKADHPNLPMAAEEIAASAAACFAAGAGAIHLHVRDAEGRHVLDASLYREVIRLIIMAVPDMMVQVTTEAVGLYTPAQQMALVRDLKPGDVVEYDTEILQKSAVKCNAAQRAAKVGFFKAKC